MGTLARNALMVKSVKKTLFTEAATSHKGVLSKKVFLEVSQNSQENRAVFSCEFCEISKNTIFTEHLWTTDVLCGTPILKATVHQLLNQSFIQ